MGRIIIPYINREAVVALRGKEIGGNTLQTKGVTLGLFGTDNIRAHEGDIYVCEGEFDTMYLDQQGYQCVGLPGADTFQEEWSSWFEKARRIFVVLDADEAGQRGAEKVKAALGAKTRVEGTEGLEFEELGDDESGEDEASDNPGTSE